MRLVAQPAPADLFSLRLEFRLADQLAPALGLGGHERAKLFRCARNRFDAQIGKRGFHAGLRQRFLKEEERKLLRSVEEAAARRKRAEEKKEREAPPKFELAEGQSIREGALSGDGRHAFLLVAQRADGAKIADVPSYVTESAYTEEIATRTNVGDRQESRRLAVLDLQERKRVWAFVDGVTFPEPEKSEAGPESKEPETQKKDAEAEKIGKRFE